MGIVYRVCEALLVRLPVDDCGRRVFAETLADWRREPRALRGSVAVVRAVAGVAAREVVSKPLVCTWIRVVAWSGAWALLGLVLSRVAYGWTGLSAYKVAAWAVSGLAFFLPAAILLSSVARRGRGQVIGLCLTSALVGLLLIGWVSPAANRVVLGRLVDMPLITQPPTSDVQGLYQAVWPQVPFDYMSGRYAHELPGLVRRGPANGWGGIYFIGFNAAFVGLCVLMPLLAMALARSHARTRGPGIASLVLFMLYRGQIADVVAPDWVLWSFVAPWLPVAVIAAATLWASGPRRPRNFWTPAPR